MNLLPRTIAVLLLSITSVACNQQPANDEQVNYWPDTSPSKSASKNDEATDPGDSSLPTSTPEKESGDDSSAMSVELELSETVPDLDVSAVSVGKESENKKNNVIDLQELLQSDQGEEAVSKLKSAIIASPRNAELHYYLGVVYHRMGDAHAALPYLSRSLELAPDDLRSLRERAAVHIRLEKHTEAIDDLTKIMELQPRSARDLVQRAMAFMRNRDYARAQNDLNHAIEIDSTIPQAYYARCLIRIRERQIEGAREDLLNAEKHQLPEERLAELKKILARATSSPTVDK